MILYLEDPISTSSYRDSTVTINLQIEMHFSLIRENQRVLIESIQQENAKFAECQAMKEVAATMEKAKAYQVKLQNIKRDMYALRDKSLKLQKRAIRLQQQKEKEAVQEEARRQREQERERQLIAKPARHK